jgi:hypothetical protein
MTTLIIFLAAWRQRRASMCRQPSACEVALEHVVWLRHDDPGMTPQQAGATIGAVTTTWAEAVLAFAAVWENLQKL